jgi:CBS domain-containing protein
VAVRPLERILEEKGHTLRVTTPEATVLEAVEVMCEARVGALLVMQSHTLVGVFSERDVMSRVVLVGLDPARTRVQSVMTTKVVCVESDVSPDEAMAIITTCHVRHLPVVDKGRVVGVVSIGDLVRWAIRDREQSIEQLRDYVIGRYPG